MPPMSLPVYSLPVGSEDFSSGAEVREGAVVPDVPRLPDVAAVAGVPVDSGAEVPEEVAAEETADTVGSVTEESGVPSSVSVSGVPGEESPGTELAGAVFTGEDGFAEQPVSTAAAAIIARIERLFIHTPFQGAFVCNTGPAAKRLQAPVKYL